MNKFPKQGRMTRKTVRRVGIIYQRQLNPKYATENPCLVGRQVFRPKITVPKASLWGESVTLLELWNYVLNHSCPRVAIALPRSLLALGIVHK